ncbi:MAG: zinc ribbon domain-containing protein [Oscillospiraceae bacterium]|jgi:uncharacterized membrane protein YvbJ|nr:zinc ribbon domain-containing protein [Oscillospiraceae bacterium]
MTNFCENCGATLTPNAKFCISCGHATSQELVIQQSGPPIPSPNQKKPLYKRWWFWLIAFAVVGLIANIIVNVIIPLENSVGG